MRPSSVCTSSETRERMRRATSFRWIASSTSPSRDDRWDELCPFFNTLPSILEKTLSGLHTEMAGAHHSLEHRGGPKTGTEKILQANQLRENDINSQLVGEMQRSASRLWKSRSRQHRRIDVGGARHALLKRDHGFIHHREHQAIYGERGLGQTGFFLHLSDQIPQSGLGRWIVVVKTGAALGSEAFRRHQPAED